LDRVGHPVLSAVDNDFGILGMKYLLLATWFVSSQPPSSYQATFNSAEACEVARKAVLADGQRLKMSNIKKPSHLAAINRCLLSLH
jgi:hypothetical protein